MQTKYITLSEMKGQFQTIFVLKNDSQYLNKQQVNFETEQFPIMRVVEKFKGDPNSETLSALDSLLFVRETYKAQMIDIIKNHNKELQLIIDKHEGTLIKKIISKVFKSKELITKKEEIKKYEQYILDIDDKPMLKDAIVMSLDDEEQLRIPFYSLKLNSIVYEVSTAFIGSLKITPYLVKEVYLYTNMDESSPCDYEFDYILESTEDNKKKELSYSSLRTFDGKRMKNGIYENFIFVNKEDAKDHVKKVLNNMKLSIDEQIKVIDEL